MDTTDHFEDPGLLEGDQGLALTSRNGSEWLANVENDLHGVVSRWVYAFTNFFLNDPCEVSNPCRGMRYLHLCTEFQHLLRYFCSPGNGICRHTGSP